MGCAIDWSDVRYGFGEPRLPPGYICRLLRAPTDWATPTSQVAKLASGSACPSVTLMQVARGPLRINADRNLLFGVRAFQNKFIDRQGLLTSLLTTTTFGSFHASSRHWNCVTGAEIPKRAFHIQDHRKAIASRPQSGGALPSCPASLAALNPFIG